MKRLFKWLIRDWWVVRRCAWPYPDGYGTYNPFRKTVLDTGLTKKEAQEMCQQLNAVTPASRDSQSVGSESD